MSYSVGAFLAELETSPAAMYRTLPVVVGIVALLAGCRDGVSPEAQLDAARSRWAGSGPSSYTVIIQRSCECTAEMTGPVIVTVRNGVVESRVYTRTGLAVTGSFVELFPTVEGLFDVVETELRDGVARLVVSYDATLGYPISIAVDRNATMVDDEYAYQATDLSPL